MSNNEAVVFYCPSCGASIAMHGDQGTCAFCGTAIERPKSARPPQAHPPIWATPSVTVVRAERAKIKRGSSCLGTLIMLVILVAVGLVIGASLMGGRLLTAISNSTGPLSQLPAVLNQIKLGPITKMAAVLPRDGKGGDLLVYTYGVSDSRYSVALIDGASHATRWQSQPLSKEAYQGQLVAGQNMIYLTDQDQLLALRLSDGTLAWQSALAVGTVSTMCLPAKPPNVASSGALAYRPHVDENAVTRSSTDGPGAGLMSASLRPQRSSYRLWMYQYWIATPSPRWTPHLSASIGVQPSTSS